MSYCEKHEREYYTLTCPDCSHESKPKAEIEGR